jgi:hypothetical protein
MRLLPWIISAAAIGAGQLLVPVATAQNQPSPPAQAPQTPQAQTPAPAISDQKLDATAAAIKSVASVQQDYQKRIAAADKSQQEGIAKEAVGAMTKAVTDQGLSVEEYSSILEMAQNNPDLRQKIIQRIRPANQPNQPDQPSH